VFKRKFNPRIWTEQHGSEVRNNPRRAMTTQLESEILRPGMSRSDVRAVLGAPERTEPRADVYLVGASPLGIDYEMYIIEYDDTDRVVKFFLRQG